MVLSIRCNRVLCGGLRVCVRRMGMARISRGAFTWAIAYQSNSPGIRLVPLSVFRHILGNDCTVAAGWY